MVLNLIAVKKLRLSEVRDPHTLQLKSHLMTIASHDQFNKNSSPFIAVDSVDKEVVEEPVLGHDREGHADLQGDLHQGTGSQGAVPVPQCPDGRPS